MSSKTSDQPTVSFFEDPLRIQTILVPIDFSEESYRALDFAVPLAQRFGATVHVVHVYEGTPDPEVARRLVERVEQRCGVHPGDPECHLRSGKPFQELNSAAKELKADLIVIASHGHRGFKHLMLGSVAEKIVRHSECPVLVVREATRGPIRTATEGIVLERILVPVDFSECAKEGAKYASVFATQVGADLLLLNVTSPPNYTAADPNIVPPDWPQLLETARLAAADRLDEMLNFLPLVGISAETQVAVGTPIEELVSATARPDIDLVIISTHGYTGLRHVLLGSTAEQLVRLAHCPVLVVPSHGRQKVD